MDKIISLFNFKNGVGKTTITYNLAKHLECNFFELEEDYLSLLKQNDDKNIVVNENTILQNGIYDINSTNRNKIKHIIQNSDYILIPTYNDFKDLIKTGASIQYAKKHMKKGTKLIVIFNRLDFTNKIPEKRFTEKSKLFLNQYCENIKYLYIRNNRAWFQDSYKDMFYLNCSVYNENTTKDKNSFDRSFIENFTHNEILEILYQYLFYYGPVYKRLSSIRKQNSNYILEKEEINELRKDFRKVEGTTMVSDNEKLLDLVFDNKNIFNHGHKQMLSNNHIMYATENDINKEKETNNSTKKELAIDRLRKKEEIIHILLAQYINLKALLTHRKVIKDFRNLLIEIDEYNWE